MTRQEWQHLMFTARMGARTRSERMSVVAQRWSYAGRSGWHYVVVDATSAARIRSFRSHGFDAHGVAR